MIKDNIKNAEIYFGLSENIKLALEIAKTINMDSLCEKTVINESLFYTIMEFDGKEQHKAIAETHKNYIDIQMVLSGEEKIGYLPMEKLTEHTPYITERDIAFWGGEFEFITLYKNDFMILFPEDGHAPGVNQKCNKIKKAVFKIKL